MAEALASPHKRELWFVSVRPGVKLDSAFRETGRALVAQGIEHHSPKVGVGRSNRLGGTSWGR